MLAAAVTLSDPRRGLYRRELRAIQHDVGAAFAFFSDRQVSEKMLEV